MYIPRLAEQKLNALLSSQKVLIILGARQVGKTTLVKRLLDRKQGIFLNLDTEVDKARLRTAAALPPLEALRTLGTPEVIVIDEAQQLPETARIVKGWYDEKLPTKVILLGSSALNLLDQSAEALTGRNLKLFLPPLTFEELLASQTWYQPQLPPAALATTLADQVQALLLEALVYGSYPEVTHTEDREEYLLNLTSDYLLKDVLQAGLVKTPQTLKQLLLYLAQHIGSELSTRPSPKSCTSADQPLSVTSTSWKIPTSSFAFQPTLQGDEPKLAVIRKYTSGIQGFATRCSRSLATHDFEATSLLSGRTGSLLR